LCSRIVEHDPEYIKKADVLVVLANGPRYGTAIEMFVAKNSGKKVIFLAKDPVPTPWPLNFSDSIVTSEAELIMSLHELEKTRNVSMKKR
jgi:nucleoside 2-deoxyribosyltransferase